MLQKFALVFALYLFVLNPAVEAFGDGPPPFVCNSLVPEGHGGRANAGILGYSLSTDSTTFSPGDTVIISLMNNVNGVSYRGLMMQVRNGDDVLSGTIALPTPPSGNSLFQSLSCPGAVPASTITHNSRTLKTNSAFMWTAPSSCGDTRTNYTVRATVVNSFRSYQIGLSASLMCVPPVPATPPSPCQIFPIMTMVPANKYDTSFEDEFTEGGISNGWRNVDGSWTRQTGGTRSIQTGPEGAEDGLYYIYFEASSPSRAGSRAQLQSDRDLRGCFCLNFYAHRYIMDGDASLGIFANDDQIYYTAERNSTWTEVAVQVETSELTQIRFEYTRGRTFLGDIAIDDINIEPGLCDDNGEDGSSGSDDS